MKIGKCVNCGKNSKRDYQEERLRAIEPGEWDSQSWRNHLAENQMEFRHPRGNEFDRFSIKKAIFPEWPSTNLQVMSETRLYLDVKKRLVWDGASYRPFRSGGGYFCTNRCAIQFATNVAIAMGGKQS